MPYHTVHFIFTNPLQENNPNYEILYTQNAYLFNRWESQNQEGKQKHKITVFRISYKVNSKWSKVIL